MNTLNTTPFWEDAEGNNGRKTKYIVWTYSEFKFERKPICREPYTILFFKKVSKLPQAYLDELR